MFLMNKAVCVGFTLANAKTNVITQHLIKCIKMGVFIHFMIGYEK